MLVSILSRTWIFKRLFIPGIISYCKHSTFHSSRKEKKWKEKLITAQMSHDSEATVHCKRFCPLVFLWQHFADIFTRWNDAQCFKSLRSNSKGQNCETLIDNRICSFRRNICLVFFYLFIFQLLVISLSFFYWWADNTDFILKCSINFLLIQRFFTF